MTQPDGYWPVTAINAGEGFSAYSQTTQDEYEAAINASTTSTFNPISGLCALLAEMPFMTGVTELGGDTGNMGVDAVNGSQTFFGSLCGIATGSTDVSNTTPQTVINTVQGMTSGANLLLTGTVDPAATGTGTLGAAAGALQQNTANHVAHQSLTTAQSLVLKQENLLISQAFSHSYDVSPDPNGNWVWVGSDGAVTMGCLQVTCNGTQLDYVSNEIPVVAGETLELTCNAKCSSLSYTGTDPVRFGIEKYRSGRTATGAMTYYDVGGYNADTLESPSATTEWLDMAGIYVVEPGVDQVRFRFQVGANATSGRVRFDEANLLKIDLIADECVPGVGLTTDAIVSKLYGTEGEGFTHNEAAVALGNTASALTALAARVAALEAEGYTGNVAADDFSWTGEITASTNWNGFYTDPTLYLGSYNADGANAKWSPAGISVVLTQECFFDWVGTDEESLSDYQIIQAVLGSAPTTTSLYRSAVYLLGRVAADWDSYILGSFWSDGTYSIDYYAGGDLTNITSGECAVPGMSSTITLYCGDKVNNLPRRFTLKVGTDIICAVDEVGTGSQYGASNRKWGWGAKAEGGLVFLLITFLAAQGVPPKINQWLAADA